MQKALETLLGRNGSVGFARLYAPAPLIERPSRRSNAALPGGANLLGATPIRQAAGAWPHRHDLRVGTLTSPTGTFNACGRTTGCWPGVQRFEPHTAPRLIEATFLWRLTNRQQATSASPSDSEDGAFSANCHAVWAVDQSLGRRAGSVCTLRPVDRRTCAAMGLIAGSMPNNGESQALEGRVVRAARFPNTSGRARMQRRAPAGAGVAEPATR